jgi:lipoprotein-anchoring transpeptidase ErfK/SrfK
MIRAFGAFLLTLPLAAVLAAPSALAQSRAQQPYYSSQAPQRHAQTGQRGRYSDEYQPPAFGHQLDAEQNGTAAPDALRPPGVIGPAAAPATVDKQDAAQGWRSDSQNVAALPPDDQPETGPPKQLPENLKRQMVNFRTREPAGTIIIDTPHTYLYLVLGHGQAIRYGIGVGREGFTWSGTERISKMKEWPDWFPPAEMIERQPYLPRMMAGGAGNPLGARALYLGHTLYRIHGTNQPSTIGKTVSSGCIRLLNSDIEDLYDRVQVGTRVVVLPGRSPATADRSDMQEAGTATAAAAPAVHRAGDDARNAPQPFGGITLFGGPLPPAR